MATYDYLCSTCGKRFDWVQSMKDDALTTCPVEVCEQDVKGNGSVERQISAGAGVIYKGEGFYLTDYAKKSSSPPSDTSENSGSSSDSGADTKKNDKSSASDTASSASTTDT